MDRLLHLSVRDFHAATASDRFYPGGGCVSALAGALAGALGQMVLRLTIGKKKYAPFEGELKALQPQIATLADELLQCVERDAEGCEAMLAAMALPKASDGEKEARQKAMAEASKTANVAPLRVCELSLQLLRLLCDNVGKVNSNCLSDWAVAAQQALAALEGAALNARINAPGVPEPGYAGRLRVKLEQELGEGRKLWSLLRDRVHASLDQPAG